MTQRAVRQYLESLSRAGVTHLPTPTQTRSLPANPVPDPIPQSTVVSKPPASPMATRQTAPEPPQAMPTVPPSPTPPASQQLAVPVLSEGASTSEKQQALDVVRQQVVACQRCDELASTRQQTVFGVGNPDARIMFIGEAPGADEDRQGEPFVGKAGQTLNRIIAACKITREEIYICNILRCRPPGNRNPSPQEAANCREYLDAQISTVQPEYIVCWGSVAAKNLLNSTQSIGKMRGQFYTYGNAKVLCTYHPSYLDRNPSAKKFTWADMKFLFADMGVEL